MEGLDRDHFFKDAVEGRESDCDKKPKRAFNEIIQEEG
jgi:hypothetical protein